MPADIEAEVCDDIVQDSGWMGELARGWYLLPGSPVQANGTNVSPWMEQRGVTSMCASVKSIGTSPSLIRVMRSFYFNGKVKQILDLSS